MRGDGDIAPEDEDPRDDDGPTGADKRVRVNNGGALPVALEAASVFALRDTGPNPMQIALFVLEHLNEKYSAVSGRVVEEPTTATGSAEPGRTRRIGTALRWYARIPPFFLRKPRRNGWAHVVKVTELHPGIFLGGQYAQKARGWTKATARRLPTRIPRRRWTGSTPTGC